MSEKPVDDITNKDPKSWQRGMLLKTVINRFGFSQSQLDLANLSQMGWETLSRCPECGALMYPRKVIMRDGQDLWIPTCTVNPTLLNHGFDKWSKHGTRGPMGRKSNTKYPKPIPPAPYVEKKDEVEIQKETTVEAPKEKITVTVKGKIVHPEVIRASKYVIAGERNIYFTGPAGTGKSTGSEHLHEILKSQDKWKDSELHMLTVSLSTFVSDLAGFIDRLNKGEFVVTELVKALQMPGVVVVDEADKGNPNLAGFWNVILANSQVNTPGGTFARHEDNVIVFIGNTTGHQPSKQYSGSVRQDYATLDRFRCFNVGFCEDVERAAIPGLNETLYDVMKSIRQNAAGTGLQRILGTRWLKRANQAMTVEGIKDARKAVKTVMQDESWSNDEILASGI